MTELIPFHELSSDLSSMILKWRNHSDIRAVMYTDHVITQEEHNAFINSLTQKQDKCYFLVLADHNPIGVIDFSDIDNTSATIGLYSDPFHSRPGQGSILMQTLLDYGFKTLKLKQLIAECFSDNVRAKHLYEKFDFREAKRFIFNAKEVIQMEYHYDHRRS